MEVDNEQVVDEVTGDEVDNAHDLELLERLNVDNDDDIPSSEHIHDMANIDDETYDPTDPDYDEYF